MSRKLTPPSSGDDTRVQYEICRETVKNAGAFMIRLDKPESRPYGPFVGSKDDLTRVLRFESRVFFVYNERHRRDPAGGEDIVSH
jgi:hypothetical protein